MVVISGLGGQISEDVLDAWEKPPGPAVVPDTTYQARLAQVRRLLDSEQLDAILVSHPATILWLTGHPQSSLKYFTQLVIAGDERDGPVLVTHAGDSQVAATRGAGLAEVRPWFYEDDHIAVLKEVLEGRGLVIGPGARIGADLDGWYRVKDLVRMQDMFGGALTDVTAPLEQLRQVLDEADQAHVRRAAWCAERGLRAAVSAIEVGVSECALAGALLGEYYRGGGEYPSAHPAVTSGERAAIGKLFPSQRQLLSGDVVTVSVWGSFHRHAAYLARTAVLGAPSPALLQNWTVARDAIFHGRQALVPGATGGDVWEIMAGILRRAEGRTPLRLGFGVGLSFPLSVIGRLGIEKGNAVPLQEDSAVALDVSIYADGEASVALGDTFIVRADGSSEPVTPVGEQLESRGRNFV